MLNLAAWDNTLQLYAEAIALAEERVDLDYLLAADEAKAKSALVQAYRGLTQYAFFDLDVRQEPFVLADLSVEERDLLSPGLWYALRMAQLCEADYLLGGDNQKLAERQRLGVVEERIGETSVRFSEGQSTEAKAVMSRRALKILSPYLYRGVRIGRA